MRKNSTDLASAKEFGGTMQTGPLNSTKDFAGATGTISIDKGHNAIKPLVVVAIKGKRFTYEAQILAQ